MRYQRKDLVAEQIGDELIIFDHTTSRIIRLNVTAGFVWKLLRKPMDLNDVILKTSQHFSETKRGEVKTLLKTLFKSMIITQIR